MSASYWDLDDAGRDAYVADALKKDDAKRYPSMTGREQMIHRTAVVTGNQWDLVGFDEDEKPTRDEPADRKAMTVASFIKCDPAEAYAYLSQEMSNSFMVELATLMKAGDKCAIGDLVMRLACNDEMCDAADSFFGRQS